LISAVNIILQSDVAEKLLQNLAEQGPVVTIAILVCLYFYKQVGKKEKEIETLNGYIRESDKENLQILNDVNNTLDKVLENQKHSNEMVVKEIENLKEYISLKLDK
jgi:hypothetical protein